MLLAAVLSPTALAACGGASGSGSTRASSGIRSAAPTVAATPGRAAVSAARSSSSAAPPDSSPGAAGFRVPRGDNSIPDFGHEAHPGERRPATAALSAFLHARAGHDWKTVCSLLAAATRRQLGALAKGSNATSGCPGILAALARAHTTPAPPLNAATGLAALRTEHNDAFALLHAPDNAKYVMPMKNEHGNWKMTQLTPLTYPLGQTGAAPSRALR
jgi:hypothetical protein